MLQKGHHSNRDFFVADLPTWSLKDDRASMEHPMFSLAKKPDTAIRRYEHNGGTITIAPGAYGMPTIWDKDVLIYCCSQLIEGIRKGKEPKRDVVFPAYNFLVSTNRSTGKRGYDLVTQALERLLELLKLAGEVERHPREASVQIFELFDQRLVHRR